MSVTNLSFQGQNLFVKQIPIIRIFECCFGANWKFRPEDNYSSSRGLHALPSTMAFKLKCALCYQQNYAKISTFSRNVLFGTTLRRWPRADPGFLNRGFKFAKGGSNRPFHPHFLRIPHENEIIWTLRGIQLNPRNPLWIRHCWRRNVWRKRIQKPDAVCEKNVLTSCTITGARYTKLFMTELIHKT